MSSTSSLVYSFLIWLRFSFIVRVLSSALGGIRALLRKSESGKERERKRGVAFVENLTHAQIALKVLARIMSSDYKELETISKTRYDEKSMGTNFLIHLFRETTKHVQYSPDNPNNIGPPPVRIT
ncbi:hypothetical protein TNCV_5089441 [Trichonephila clavipes]|nr:hypothetical protein TNCV_5089441 [Trichonephila clavipes]